MPDLLRVGVLVSGGGSNLQALVDACRAGAIPAEIAVVISNVPAAFALVRARQCGIPAAVFFPPTGSPVRKTGNRQILDFLESRPLLIR